MTGAPFDTDRGGEVHPTHTLTATAVARGEVWEDGNPPPTKK